MPKVYIYYNVLSDKRTLKMKNFVKDNFCKLNNRKKQKTKKLIKVFIEFKMFVRLNTKRVYYASTELDVSVTDRATRPPSRRRRLKYFCVSFRWKKVEAISEGNTATGPVLDVYSEILSLLDLFNFSVVASPLRMKYAHFTQLCSIVSNGTEVCRSGCPFKSRATFQKFTLNSLDVLRKTLLIQRKRLGQVMSETSKSAGNISQLDLGFLLVKPFQMPPLLTSTWNATQDSSLHRHKIQTMGRQCEETTSSVLSKRFPLSNKYSSTLLTVLQCCYL